MDDPTSKDFWLLRARVDAHDSKFDTLIEKIDKLSDKVDHLNAIAERGKGAYWGAMALASSGAAFMAWLGSTFLNKPGP